MTLLSEYYEASLYPLQDGVLNAVSSCKTSFYLTGGTAISRAYYRHRYSDDLDFFVNADPNYQEQVNLITAKLREAGFFWNAETDFLRRPNYAMLKVRWTKTDAVLKLDFVNDVPAHFGGFQETELFPKTDSLRNMLSNKLSALFRYESKDVADICEIAQHGSFDWAEIIKEARAKENGLEIPLICEVLKGLPAQEFENIKWINKPDFTDFLKDIDKLVFKLLSLS